MKTDLLLVPMGATYAAMRRAAMAAEEAGFDGIWTWDHLRPDGPGSAAPLECWTVLSALAEATSRVMIGPLTLNVANRHPGVLANMAATLQEVSGGRLLLGIGAGGSKRTPYAAEQLALGRDVPGDRTRAAQVVEACTVMRRLWAGDATDFEGTHFRLRSPDSFRRPEPPPPIVVGAFGERMARVAGEAGDGLNTQASHPRLEEMVATARRAHAAASRDPAAFLVTVFSGLSERWLRPDSSDRRRLGDLGVDRVILLVEPPFEPRTIAEAGRALRG